MLALALAEPLRMTGNPPRARRDECPLCPPTQRYPGPQDRFPDLRRHMVERHAAAELADALILIRSQDFTRAVVSATVRVSRVEHACADSPLSRAIVDAWPAGNPRTGEIADLVGEREVRVLAALRRLVAERVVARAGLGRWRML